VTVQRFAAWVEPIAAQYRDGIAEGLRLARALRPEQLSLPSAEDAGWTVRDELVHMAASGGDFQRLLGAIVRGEQPDTSVFADTDARNARNLEARKAHSLEQVAAELEENGRVQQGLLAQLTDADESRTPDGMPFGLKDLLAGYGQHDAYHLAQIAAAIAAGE
jgi:uncharacterized damage-inducible protein DinB